MSPRSAIALRTASPVTTGPSDAVALTTTSAQSERRLELDPGRGPRRRSAPRPRPRLAWVRFATATSAIPRRDTAFSVCSPMRPAPTTSTRLPASVPRAPSASASAIELAVAGFAPIAVSERARRPAMAVRKSSWSTSPTVPPPARLEGVAHLPEDLGLAEDERVQARGHAAQVARDVLVDVDVQVVDEQVAVDAVRAGEHVDHLVAGALDAVGEVGVELDAVAGREHGVLLHRGAARGARPEASRDAREARRAQCDG